MILSCLYVAPTDSMGRGVFTSRRIEGGIVIEESPVIVMSGHERKLLDQTLLHDYIFEWGENKDQCCMALGYVPLYNHSRRSNCEYEMNFDRHVIRVTTLRAVGAGDELFINYNGAWNDDHPVWFQTK